MKFAFPVKLDWGSPIQGFGPKKYSLRHIATIHEETTTPGIGVFSGMIWKRISAWKHGSYVIIQITLM